MTDYGRPLSFGIFPPPDADGLPMPSGKRSTSPTKKASTSSGFRTIRISAGSSTLSPCSPPSRFNRADQRVPRRGQPPPPSTSRTGKDSGDDRRAERRPLRTRAGRRRLLGRHRRHGRTPADARPIPRGTARGDRGDQAHVEQPAVGPLRGVHHQLAGVRPGPPPAHRIGIWLGVYGPRALRLLGETADGWIPSIPSMPVADLDARHEAIDEAAVAAGREPASIRRLANVNGVVTDHTSEGFLRGPSDQWVDELTTWRSATASTASSSGRTETSSTKRPASPRSPQPSARPLVPDEAATGRSSPNTDADHAGYSCGRTRPPPLVRRSAVDDPGEPAVELLATQRCEPPGRAGRSGSGNARNPAERMCAHRTACSARLGPTGPRKLGSGIPGLERERIRRRARSCRRCRLVPSVRGHGRHPRAQISR